MKKINIMLLLAFAISVTFAQQASVAVLPSDGAAVFDSDDLEALTNKMRNIALKVLPREKYILLTQDVVIRRLGGVENYMNECRESSCIVDLGKKAQVDYVAQAGVGRLRDKMRVKVEVYNVGTGALVGMYDGDGKYFDDYFVLLEAVDRNVPDIFAKIAGVSVAVAPAVSTQATVQTESVIPANKTLSSTSSQKVSILENVTFLTGKSELTPEAKQALDGIAKQLQKTPNVQIEIHVHTDNQGTITSALLLSEQRAVAVVRYLEEKGIDNTRLKAVGHGPKNPIASNSTAAGRQKNRRVELVIK